MTTWMPFNPLVITPISGAGTAFVLPPYSTRGVSQTLEQIKPGGGPMGTLIRRTIDGRLINMTHPQFHLYRSAITCRDVQTPCLDDGWFGQVVQVDCTARLSYVTATGSPQRAAVSGTSYEEDHITYYCPSLIMMVVDIRNSFAAWEAEYSWQIELEELEPLSPP